MNPVRLLLVEDDGVSRGFLSQALRQYPAVVDAAENAAQACVLAASERYDLLLLDANLPDGSGEELLRDLQSSQSGIVALCLTAEATGLRTESLITAGFAEIVIKPVSVALLHAALDRHLPAGRLVDTANANVSDIVWDDAQGLSALGDNRAALDGLRALFLAELPGENAQIATAHAAGDAVRVRHHLHRLKASCGFVGSTRLLQAVRALHEAPLDTIRLEVFKRALMQTLAARDPTKS
ncbi:MAG: response regulator [Lysobacteraceae bacterium]